MAKKIASSKKSAPIKGKTIHGAKGCTPNDGCNTTPHTAAAHISKGGKTALKGKTSATKKIAKVATKSHAKKGKVSKGVKSQKKAATTSPHYSKQGTPSRSAKTTKQSKKKQIKK